MTELTTSAMPSLRNSRRRVRSAAGTTANPLKTKVIDSTRSTFPSSGVSNSEAQRSALSRVSTTRALSTAKLTVVAVPMRVRSSLRCWISDDAMPTSRKTVVNAR
jgi:hypothetical protein